jgi:hypothetical protein
MIQLKTLRTLTGIFAFMLIHLVTCANAQGLVLLIDKQTGQIDWLDGFMVTKTNGVANNIFGSFSTADAKITSPLLLYSGAGVMSGVSFDFSLDGSTVVGIGLDTFVPPGNPASFSGTPEGPATPTFSTGDISQFTALAYGDYTLAPVSSWSGGIEVRVVPEPNAIWLILFGTVALFSFTFNRTMGKSV